jgi:dihydroorotase
MIRTLEAVCVSSFEVARHQIRFDDETGLILEVGELGVKKPDYVFSDDCLLFAGMGDVHIHAREDVSGKNCYKEDFTTAHAAMKNGGVCHAGDMPNNPISPVDNKSYEEKVRLGEKAEGDMWFYAGIGPGTSPLSYSVPYKVYMGPSIGDLFFRDLPTLDQALSRYEGQWVSFHCEDPEILEETKNETHHHERRPVRAEAVATRDAIGLIEKYKLKGKLCHYSSQKGLELVRAARARGVDISLEVTPQHLYFAIDELPEDLYKPLQMNPPIRMKLDRETLLEALKKGEIQYLATDHAPHSKEEKAHGHSGLTGLDTYGPFVTWLIAEGLSPKIVAKISAENPGDFFNHFLPSWKKITRVYENMGHGLGYLRPGFRANFTVLNLKKPVLIEEKNLRTKVGHSPFTGHTFPGSVEALFVGGKKA